MSPAIRSLKRGRVTYFVTNLTLLSQGLLPCFTYTFRDVLELKATQTLV